MSDAPRTDGQISRTSPNSQATGSSPSVEFDRYSEQYSAGMENPLKQFAGDNAEVFIELKASILLDDLKKHPLPTGGRRALLDFGCGDGVLLRLLGARDFPMQLYGSDVSSGMLRTARAQWQQSVQGNPALAAREPVWAQSESASLPFDTASFDVVTCLGVFHHIAPADRDYNWSEIARVLRPGGRCYVFEHNPYNPLTQWVVRHTAIDANAVLLTAAETRRALRRQGLLIRRSHGLMYWPPKWKRLWAFEKLVRWIPLGGQFLVIGERIASPSK